MVDELLSDKQVRERGLFRPAAVHKLVNEQCAGTQDWSMQIWQLLTLEIWTRLFLDGGAREFAEEKIQAQQVTSA
jgi:asparagine synthase (glutamine-hydrolysing)